MSQGRPSAYTEEIAQEILSRMIAGESVKAICDDDHMPARSTVMLWAAENREGFSDRYAKAYEARAYHWADELLDIADDGTNDWMEHNDQEGNCVGYKLNGENVARSRLRVDSRKWLLSKMLPKFSDKYDINHGLQANNPITELLRQISGKTIDPNE